MPGRRPIVVLVALFGVPLPACLHISAPTAPAEDAKGAKAAPPAAARAADPGRPQPPRLDFASLPRVPGSVVRTHPAPAPHPNTVAQKPPPKPPPLQIEPAQGAEPGQFPVLPLQTSEPPILAAVREYCAGRSDRAIAIIRTLPPQNQDVVLALLPVLARAAGPDFANDPATVGALVEQLHTAANRLEPLAPLKIEKVVFCNNVSGFGRFVPRAPDAAYRPNAQAELYFEVRNLVSAPVGDGFLTQVHATVEVRDAHQRLVEQIDPDDFRRRVPVVRFERQLPSRTPLHDFHVLYKFSAPPAPGVYTVTVELRDVSGRRVAKTAPAQFCVAGP